MGQEAQESTTPSDSDAQSSWDNLVSIQHPDTGQVIQTTPDTAQSLIDAGHALPVTSDQQAQASQDQNGVTPVVPGTTIADQIGNWMAQRSAAAPPVPDYNAVDAQGRPVDADYVQKFGAYTPGTQAPTQGTAHVPAATPAAATGGAPAAPPAKQKTIADLLKKYMPHGGGGGGSGTSALAAQQTAADQAAQQVANESGAAEQGAAAINRGVATQAIQKAAAEDQANQAARQAFQQVRDQRLNTYQQLLNADRNLKVDPSHFWASKNIGQRVSATLGVALGAIGSAFTKTPNAALDILNKAQEEDFEAQRQNIEGQRANTAAQGNFVAAANAAGLSDQEAKELHAQRFWENTDRQLNMLKSTLTSDQAKAQADALSVGAKQQAAQHGQALAQLSSNLATAAASRYHMGLENQQLAYQMALQKLQGEHPELFRNPDQLATIGGQKIDVGQGNSGKAVTDYVSQTQQAVSAIDKALQAQREGQASWNIPFTENKRLGEDEADAIKGAVAPLIAANPRLGARLVEKLPSNARSSLGDTPQRLYELRQHLIDELGNHLQSSSNLTPQQAAQFTNQLFQTK